MKKLIKVQFRRRRQNKTDYFARRRLLERNLPRIVARKTSRYIIAQLVESKEAQDFVICSVNSKDLIKYGWPKNYSIKNIPASYLAGFLLGRKMLEKEKDKAILDMGLIRSTKGSKIYALLKGAVDAGIEIPHSESILPSKERISGEHISKEFKSIFEKVKGAIEKK
jgi:large subunit ribosomal protein L18